MALIIEKFLLCDGCDESFGVYDRIFHGWMLRNDAKKDGWICKNGTDICPECQKKGIRNIKKHKDNSNA